MRLRNPVEDFPLHEMVSRAQWVGFRLSRPKVAGGKPRKIPFVADPDACNACAKSTDPATWRPFDDAVRGLRTRSFAAVAYALTPEDRIVLIDLDGPRWVGDNGLTTEAASVVQELGGYAELSLSGKGVHVLLRGQLRGGGRVNDEGVEVYAHSRFVICTGRHLPTTPQVLVENQAALEGFIVREFRQRGAEVGQSTQLHLTPLTPLTHLTHLPPERAAQVISKIIAKTLPTGEGQRYRKTLEFARGLKFDAGLANADLQAVIKPLVRQWHAAALPVIEHKAFEVSWSDFLAAFRSAKTPLESVTITEAVEKARKQPHPLAIEYGMPQVKLLVSVCFHLSQVSGDGIFFLSSHSLKDALDMTPPRILRLLGVLVVDGVLECVEAGRAIKAASEGQPGQPGRATRYRWTVKPSPT